MTDNLPGGDVRVELSRRSMKAGGPADSPVVYAASAAMIMFAMSALIAAVAGLCWLLDLPGTAAMFLAGAVMCVGAASIALILRPGKDQRSHGRHPLSGLAAPADEVFSGEHASKLSDSRAAASSAKVPVPPPAAAIAQADSYPQTARCLWITADGLGLKLRKRRTHRF